MWRNLPPLNLTKNNRCFFSPILHLRAGPVANPTVCQALQSPLGAGGGEEVMAVIMGDSNGLTRFSSLEYQAIMFCLAFAMCVTMAIVEVVMKRFALLPVIFPGVFAIREKRLYFFDIEVKEVTVGKALRWEAMMTMRVTLAVVLSYLWEFCVFQSTTSVGRAFPLEQCQSGMDWLLVSDLKSAAQQHFGKQLLRLISTDAWCSVSWFWVLDTAGIPLEGRFLEPEWSLADAGLTDGSTVTAVVQSATIAASDGAFAVWCIGGHVVTWGDGQCGGDSEVVKDQLTHVLKVQSTGKAFAALKSDGKVVCWGHPNFGGDNRRVQHLLDKAQDPSIQKVLP
eukprot:s156_g2.t1